MIAIEEKHLKILLEILSQAKTKFYAFGSRTTASNRKFSDLDLCYKDTIAWETLVKIKTDLEESNLPFKVDLVDYNECSEDFKQIIDKDLIELTESNF